MKMARLNAAVLLKSLRNLFKNKKLIKHEINAYIIPHDDSHNNEYIADSDDRLQFISNFSGSCGTAIVTDDHAALWADGRYHLQAAEELDSTCWTLMKDGLDNVPEIKEWLVEILKPDSKVGIDPQLISNSMWQSWVKQLKKHKLILVPVSPNLIDEIWIDKPPRPKNYIFPLDIKFSGQSWQSKVNLIMEIMAGRRDLGDGASIIQALPNGYEKSRDSKMADAVPASPKIVPGLRGRPERAGSLLLSALDEVAWLLNLRGSEIPYNPVFFAYALVNRYPIKFIAGSRFSEVSESFGPEIVLFYDPVSSDGNGMTTQLFHEEVRKLDIHEFLLKNLDSGTNRALLNHLQIIPDGGTTKLKNGAGGPEDDFVHDSQVKILPYGSIFDYLRDIDWKAMGPNYKIWLSPSANYALHSLIPSGTSGHPDGPAREPQNLFNEPSPVLILKAIKNPTEVEGAKIAHVLDAMTLCEFFAWLTANVGTVPNIITEVSAAEKLLQIRTNFFIENGLALKELNGKYLGPEGVKDCFRGLSFGTISSVGSHSAVIHYHPQPSTDRPIQANQIYLCDSGSQYLFGTTDVTRTFYFGDERHPEPTGEMKRSYTLVLKGHLALSRAVFPKGCKGYRLDPLARQHLWEYGLDYLHGTGHGVGAFLNVHEGPEVLGQRSSAFDSYPIGLGIQENSLLTIEPGFYEADKFGFRIENTCYVVKANTKYNFNDKTYLTFKPLTLVPYQLNLIDKSILTTQEIDQINAYHILCREHVGKELEKLGKHETLNWFKEQTLPLLR